MNFKRKNDIYEYENQLKFNYIPFSAGTGAAGKPPPTKTSVAIRFASGTVRLASV